MAKKRRISIKARQEELERRRALVERNHALLRTLRDHVGGRIRSINVWDGLVEGFDDPEFYWQLACNKHEPLPPGRLSRELRYKVIRVPNHIGGNRVALILPDTGGSHCVVILAATRIQSLAPRMLF